MRKKILFLDLEGVVITSWNDPFKINIEKLQLFLKMNHFDEVSIFSFAIYHETDLETFISEPAYKEHIEECLEVKLNVDLIPTIKQLQVMFAREYNLPPSKVSQSDFFEFNGKESGFITYCRQNFKDSVCTLIDDAIWDEIHMEIINKNLCINTRNILSL